jgi:hypothetical protein
MTTTGTLTNNNSKEITIEPIIVIPSDTDGMENKEKIEHVIVGIEIKIDF